MGVEIAQILLMYRESYNIMENANMNLIFSEIKKIREDLDYLRSIVESNVDDIILTKDEEELIKDTRLQKQKGKLLNFEDVFGDCRTYAFETLFSISIDVFCIVYSILTNIRCTDADYQQSNV